MDDLALDRLLLVWGGPGWCGDLGAISRVGISRVRILVRIADVGIPVGVGIRVGPVRPAETADEDASAPPPAMPVAMPMPAAIALPLTTAAVPGPATALPPAATST